jgi:hypothetical protein
MKSIVGIKFCGQASLLRMTALDNGGRKLIANVISCRTDDGSERIYIIYSIDHDESGYRLCTKTGEVRVRQDDIIEWIPVFESANEICAFSFLTTNRGRS